MPPSSSLRRSRLSTFTRNASIAAILAIALLSCERQKGALTDLEYASPTVHTLSLSASALDLDASPRSPLIDSVSPGHFRIQDTVTITATDPAGASNIRRISFTVTRTSDASLVASGSLGSVSDASVGPAGTVFRGIIGFTLSRTDAGTYLVDVSAATLAGSESNHIRASLMIRRNNTNPILGSPGARLFFPSGPDSALVTVTIPARDSDGLGDISHVTVRALQASDGSIHEMSDDGLIAVSGDELQGDGVYTTVFWVHPLTTYKNVILEFTAVDSHGALSNTVSRALDNQPPIIQSLDAPDSIQRPASGSSTATFHLTASDPDGLGDIDSVYFRNFTSTSQQIFLMYDDGSLVLHGDVTASDGIYSVIIQVPSSTTTGRKEFHFYVTDKSGARTTTIKYITIY